MQRGGRKEKCQGFKGHTGEERRPCSQCCNEGREDQMYLQLSPSVTTSTVPSTFRKCQDHGADYSLTQQAADATKNDAAEMRAWATLRMTIPTMNYRSTRLSLLATKEGANRKMRLRSDHYLNIYNMCKAALLSHKVVERTQVSFPGGVSFHISTMMR